jgi:hypothetical protein
MNPLSELYLRWYIEKLDAVAHEETVFSGLAEWQYKRFQDGTQAAVVEVLNTQYGTGLVPNHLPTTAVGRLDGLVIVSANPGFSPYRNAMEQNFRAESLANNALFLRGFFSQYPAAVAVEHRGLQRRRTTPYWTKALRLWERSFMLQPPILPSLNLWDVAASAALRNENSWIVGGVDLFPFHSTNDSITWRMHGPQQVQTLSDVARATLKMLLSLPAPTHGRFNRRLVIVSSRAGSQLIEEVGEGLLGAWQNAGPPRWNMSHAVSNSGAATVLRIPYQIFSQGYPPLWDGNIFAQCVTNLQHI